MCGIAGFLDFSCLKGSSELQSIVQRMSDSLSHRGPDDSGMWVDSANGIALGHRRLSILDLSQQGHQPMHSSSGRYVIVYNGEIYNHDEIRKKKDKTLFDFSSALTDRIDSVFGLIGGLINSIKKRES